MANPLFDTVFGQHQDKETPFLEMADGSVITHSEFLQLTAQYANLNKSRISGGVPVKL